MQPLIYTFFLSWFTDLKTYKQQKLQLKNNTEKIYLVWF